MLTMKRRDMMLGAAAIAAFPGGVATAANHARSRQSLVTVYSPGFPRAKALAQKNAKGAKRAQPLQGDIVSFYNSRLAAHRGPIEGYTSWSDYVLLRGLAEERGLRLRAETQLPGAGKTLFRWVMA